MLFRGLLVGAASGKLGSLVASHNSGGQYMRARVTPTNPQTSRQLVVRNNFASLANAYANVLTDEQRLAWKTFGLSLTGIFNPMGDAITLSAIAAFVRQNAARLQAGLDVVVDPPADGTAAVLSTGTNANIVGDDLSVVFTDTDGWATADGGALLVYTGRPLNPGESFYKGPYRFAGSILGDTGTPPTSPGTITDGALLWGPPTTGQISLVRLVAVTADGRLSNVINGKMVAP